jgi:hypothetical protein
MSEIAKASPHRPLVIGTTVAVIAAIAGLYLIAGETRKPPQSPTSIGNTAVSRSLATGSLAAFVVKSERKPVAEIAFTDGDG